MSPYTSALNFVSSTGFWGVLYVLLVIGVILVIISQNRQPYKALNWILVLVLLPPLGLILYFFFGISFRGKKLIPLKAYQRLLDEDYPGSEPAPNRKEPIEGRYKELSAIPFKQLGIPLTTICSIKDFPNGRAKFENLLEDMKKATRHIHLQYYILNDDKVGTAIQKVLIEKAREGLEVRVLYDGVGSWTTSKNFFREMEDAGVQVAAFMPVVFPYLTNKANYRNHRKIVVIDGEVGYIGGMNVAERYVVGDKLGMWKDNHFRVTGEGVKLLQNVFMIDWYVTKKILLPYEPYLGSHIGSDKDCPLIQAQFFGTGPTDNWRILQQTLCKTMMTAKKSIYIETPYFLPPEALNRAIIGAAIGGVEVNILVPKRSDIFGMQWAMMSYFSEMAEAGINVYYYEKGFNHSKIMVVDDEVVILGSANMDYRSLEHNFEVTGIVYDQDFAKNMRVKMQEDMEDAQRFLPGTWSKMNIFKRMASSFFRLVAPQL